MSSIYCFFVLFVTEKMPFRKLTRAKGGGGGE